MSETQSKIMGALTVLPEVDQLRIWEFIQACFGNDDALTAEEIQVIQAYMAGDEAHQATIDFDTAKEKWLADE